MATDWLKVQNTHICSKFTPNMIRASVRYIDSLVSAELRISCDSFFNLLFVIYSCTQLIKLVLDFELSGSVGWVM